MKKIIWITTLILSTFSISVNADNHRGAMEFFACSFNEGKDMSDMMKVTEEWQRFADKNFSETYQAGIMSPYLASTGDFPMDFIWVGFSKDQENLGESQMNGSPRAKNCKRSLTPSQNATPTRSGRH